MNRGRFNLILLAAILILACYIPVTFSVVAVPTETALPAEVAPTSSLIDEPETEAATLSAPTAVISVPTATACRPQLAANSAVNVRLGPGTVYGMIGALTTGQIAAIDGRNSEGTWWYIVFPSGPGGHGWVAASVTTASCNATGVAVVAAPPTPIDATGVVTKVIAVSVWVDPKVISLGGCLSPQPISTVGATIEVSGATKIKYHFNTDQLGALATHTLTFTKAGAKDVEDSFTPLLTSGTYWVRLVIDGVDTSGMGIQAKYKITC